MPARPAPYASYLVLVHRLASLLHASFGPRLTASPLRFAITSPPSGCEEDFHLQAVKHARHTKQTPSPLRAGGDNQTTSCGPLRSSAPRWRQPAPPPVAR